MLYSDAAEKIVTTQITLVVSAAHYHWSNGPVLSEPQLRATHSPLLERTVVVLVAFAVLSLVVDFATRTFIVDASVIVVLLVGALGLKATDAIARWETC